MVLHLHSQRGKFRFPLRAKVPIIFFEKRIARHGTEPSVGKKHRPRRHKIQRVGIV